MLELLLASPCPRCNAKTAFVCRYNDQEGCPSCVYDLVPDSDAYVELHPNPKLHAIHRLRGANPIIYEQWSRAIREITPLQWWALDEFGDALTEAQWSALAAASRALGESPASFDDEDARQPEIFSRLSTKQQTALTALGLG